MQCPIDTADTRVQSRRVRRRKSCEYKQHSIGESRPQTGAIRDFKLTAKTYATGAFACSSRAEAREFSGEKIGSPFGARRKKFVGHSGE